MGGFFNGWRRKAGCVALVMALVFMGASIRCFYYEDWCFVRFGGTFYLLRSDRGGLSCNSWGATLPKSIPLVGSQPVTPVAILATGAAPQDTFFVYYSGTTILLTLFSAYLILWTPRQSPIKPPD